MAGRGRGNLLELMKKKKLEEEQKLKHEEEERLKREEEERLKREEERLKREEERLKREEETHTQEVVELEAQIQNVLPTQSRGRGNLLQKMRQSSSESSPVASTTASVTSIQTTSTSTIGQGRGSLLSAMKKKSTLDTSKGSSDQSMIAGKLGSLSLEDTRSSFETEPEIVSRQGEFGKTINLTANYVNLKVDKSKGMFQYEVKFDPDIDCRSLRFKLLNQHLSELGNVKTFDGVLLYLPIKLPDNITIFESLHPVDNSRITLKIIFKKKQAMKDNIAFFNTLMNRVLRALTLVRIGRHDFNPKLAHKIPQHRLEVWPGYVTAINELEGGLKLNLDATHRVMRLDTVRDLMTDFYKRNPNNFKKNVMNEIVGTSVLTRYNNRVYKIDDIDWNSNPTLQFQRKNETVSLVDYYKIHYGTIINDLRQPLLVHRSKEKKSTGETVENVILLIPELCFLAGLTDNIRTDFKIMKDLAQVTKVSPEQRRQVIKKFIQEVNSNEVTKNILSDWGLEIENDTVDVRGRFLGDEELIFGNDFRSKATNGEWKKAASNSIVLRTPNLAEWAIICTQRNRKNGEDFLEAFKTVCHKVKIKIGEPRVVILRDDATENYVQELRKLLNNPLNMVVIIFPTMRQDKYSAVKKICCVEKPVPSQVIIAKTISKPDKLKSVVEKIALQINCKIGGALWALKNPFSNAMICGIDVYHAGVGQGTKGSVAAFVASLDKMLSSWHSKVCMQGPHQELIDLLKQCFISALKVYRARNGMYPDKIIIYRDGVGDGQLDTVKNYEVKQLLQSCSIVDPSYKPKVSVVIVQKRVNTRIFEKKGQLGNPPPGTVVDSIITRRYLYDFYLVPQMVTQGTVTPTHYIVLHDGADVKTDHLQRFTYKLCHLYYNWPGTIRVPAPCQYAHKLAYLVGQSLKIEPSQELDNLLYYL